MRIDEFRRILQEFSRQTRQGLVVESQVTRTELVALAEKIESILGRSVRLNDVKSGTISFAPDRCPTCGK
jgi:hypothetical protein